MEAYRRLWMRRMVERDNRIVDSQIVGNLMRSASFFASAPLIIIGALLAALGRSDPAVACSTNGRWRAGSSGEFGRSDGAPGHSTRRAYCS